MRKAIPAIVLVLALACVARAELKDYIDDKTVLAAEADLSKVDPMALEVWARKLANATGVIARDPKDAKKFDDAMGRMRTWLGEFKKAGGTKVYMIMTADLFNDGEPLVIADAGTPDQAKQLASVLFSGKANGPTEPEPADKSDWPHMPTGEVIRDGKAAALGTDIGRRYANSIVAKDRPDLAAALANAGNSVGRGAFAPNDEFRKQTQMFLSLHDVKWLAVKGDVQPAAALKITVQSNDAAGAKSVGDMIATLMKGIPPQAKLTPKFIEMITPSVANDQVVLDLDDAKLVALAAELKGTLQMAKRQAMQVSSASNMRQILVGCAMYAVENKEAWPADLKAIGKFVGTADVFKNPARPEKGYTYVKPADARKNSTSTVVLYEEHDQFGDGVNVGFADGHVEFVKDQKRFDELLAATK